MVCVLEGERSHAMAFEVGFTLDTGNENMHVRGSNWLEMEEGLTERKRGLYLVQNRRAYSDRYQQTCHLLQRSRSQRGPLQDLPY